MLIMAGYFLCVVRVPLPLCCAKLQNIHLLLHACRSISLSLLSVILLAAISEPDPTSAKSLGVAPTLIMFLVVTVIFIISYRIFRFLWR